MSKALFREDGVSSPEFAQAVPGLPDRTASADEPERYLNATAVPVDRLAGPDIDDMFGLYDSYYGGTSRALFERDLMAKDLVFTLSARGVIRGFSTLMRFEADFGEGTADFLYSGDTIIDHRFWGRNDFALTWIRHAGRIKASVPDRPLYWFLTVKGHRTYRYLSVFSREYYPAHNRETPERAKSLIDSLGQRHYGARYDPLRGIVHFPRSQGHLKPEWAVIPERETRRPEVRFFLERNPGYGFGDEMVCLCLLSEDNLKPVALRAFQAGLRDAREDGRP